MNEFDKALKEYDKAFNEMFPLSSMLGYPQKEIIEIIKKCIAENKDVEEMGYLIMDNDIFY